jgi:hypothetical protein
MEDSNTPPATLDAAQDYQTLLSCEEEMRHAEKRTLALARKYGESEAEIEAFRSVFATILARAARAREQCKLLMEDERPPVSSQKPGLRLH